MWTPRSHSRIVLADLGSKFSASSDEWGIDRTTLNNIFCLFDCFPTVDCFASEVNTICSSYFSKIPQNKCSGINFFCQELIPGNVYFCCPPVKDVDNTIKHLLKFSNILAILIIPHWYSAQFWPSLHDGKSFRPEIVNHVLFSSNFLVFNQCDSIFSRKVTFKMLALKIKTN